MGDQQSKYIDTNLLCFRLNFTVFLATDLRSEQASLPKKLYEQLTNAILRSQTFRRKMADRASSLRIGLTTCEVYLCGNLHSTFKRSFQPYIHFIKNYSISQSTQFEGKVSEKIPTQQKNTQLYSASCINNVQYNLSYMELV